MANTAYCEAMKAFGLSFPCHLLLNSSLSGGGLPQAAVNLGNIYRVGVENVEVDLIKARGYFAAFAHKDSLCSALLAEVDKEIAGVTDPQPTRIES